MTRAMVEDHHPFAKKPIATDYRRRSGLQPTSPYRSCSYGEINAVSQRPIRRLWPNTQQPAVFLGTRTFVT